MNKMELLAIFAVVQDFSHPIIRGRETAEIFVSIPAGNPIPAGWVRCQETVGYYPVDTLRIKWKGGV